MSRVNHEPQTVAVSPRTDIAGEGYCLDAHLLPRSSVPSWMRLGLVLSVAVVCVLGGLALTQVIDERVPATGRVSARRVRLVTSPLSGVLGEVVAREGELLRAGQVLARVIPGTNSAGGLQTISSPVSGRVVGLTAWEVGGEVSEGQVIAKILEDERYVVLLTASEDRLHLIQPGARVRFSAKNNPDRLAPFGVARVREVALDRDNGGGYQIVADVEQIPYPLVYGAGVQAEILVGRRAFWQMLFGWR